MDANTLRTYSGKHFSYENPNIEMIDIIDIAMSLSMKCRMNGHTSFFYSIAQHSVELSKRMGNSLPALLHDASECYLSDVPSPLKKILPCYLKVERKINRIIEDKFEIKFDKNIKTQDRLLMDIEHISLFQNKTPFDLWDSNKSYNEFLKQYELCIK